MRGWAFSRLWLQSPYPSSVGRDKSLNQAEYGTAQYTSASRIINAAGTASRPAEASLDRIFFTVATSSRNVATYPLVQRHTKTFR